MMRSALGLLGSLVATLALLLAVPAPAGAAYPERPVTLIVPWGAGGGTDAVARIVGSLLERELGQPVNVVNRTGGSGVVGHSAVATAAADGYTLGMITGEIGMMHWQGLTELTHRDYTPLALLNFDPAGFQVGVDSPFKTLKEVVDAVKANPGKYKASGTGQGGIWHLALAGMLHTLKVDPKSVPWVPSNGAAPAMQDLAAGGIDFVTCSVPEARAMLDAGKARSLAVMSDRRNPTFPNVPTMKEAIGVNFEAAAWRGLVGPKGLPKEAVDRLVPAMKKVYDSKEYQEFMAQRGFGVIYGDPKAFLAYMEKNDTGYGVVMKQVGLTK
jgi:tripartite-type tricarboxylate transporter receptor subunit TctC